MYKQPKLTKVPGDISRGNEKEKQGFIQDITKLTRLELLDLKERQELLLRNKNRIAKLPDKGEKIKSFYNQILKQLEVHDNVDRAAEMFSELNIASVGKKSLAKMEWNGKYNARHDDDTAVDSDDDLDEQNIDPLKILAQSTNLEKKVVVAKPEPSLITDKDLEEIETMKKEQPESVSADLVELDLQQTTAKVNNLLKKWQENDNIPDENLDGHAIYICKKELSKKSKEKFLPFKTTKSNVHDPEKEKQRFLQHMNKWDNTSATPPSISHSPAKLLTLEESIKVQVEQNKLLERAKESYAQERLKQREAIKQTVMATIQNDVMRGSSEFTTYRDISDSEEEQLTDDEDAVDYESDSHDN